MEGKGAETMTDLNNRDKKAYPEINRIECKGCGRCVDACPKTVLRLSKSLNERGYRYVEYVGEGCIGCANCFYVCPEPNTFRIHRIVRR